jgi:hypothetical protein
MQVKGEFTQPMMLKYWNLAFKFTMSRMLIALLTPLALIFLTVLLIHYGMPNLAALLK